MSDAFYFICLGISIASAFVVPIAIGRGIRHPETSRNMSAWSGFGVAVGFVCSLPFGRTVELPWYPYVAGAYFGGFLLWMLFYHSLSRSQFSANTHRED